MKSITLEEAKELYNSDNQTLKDIALRFYDIDKLMDKSYNEEITTFDGALTKYLAYKFDDNPGMVIEKSKEVYDTIRSIAKYSKASAARFQLHIITSALNLKHRILDLYYPKIYISNEKHIKGSRKLCKFIINNTEHFAHSDIEYCVNPLECNTDNKVNSCDFNGYIIGCHSEECAIYLGLKFYDVILTAIYGDDPTFKIL